MKDVVVENASEICQPEASGTGIQRLVDHTLIIKNGRVAWLGPRAHAPEALLEDVPRYDAGGRAVLPALIDCHTHLVWGGDRVEDFALRACGTSYAEIAARGGGIITTVSATRQASKDTLVESTREKLVRRRRYGIGTTEIKSGYGLTVEHELTALEVVDALRQEGWDLEGTLLAAHAVPKDIERETYLSQIVDTMIPQAAERGLARFVDAFVEKGAYTREEARRVFEAARAHGLTPRVHADQITPGGGAELAAEVSAASADHLENISDAGIERMAEAGVIGTLLPGALVFLGDEPNRLGRRLVDGGVQVAVATDANPGSSPLFNLPLAATLATTLFGLSAEEAIRAVTRGAAQALLREDVGHFDIGAQGRFIVLDHRDSRALVYAFGEPIVRAFADGTELHEH